MQLRKDAEVQTGNRKFFLPFLTKISCLMTGDDFYVLRQLNDPKSNKRIQTLAMLMLLPMTVWFAAVFMISQGVFGLTWPFAIFAGCIAGFIILIVERSIIMSDGNPLTFFVRFSLALVLAIVGAFLIDEVMFAKDIDAAMAEQAESAARTKSDAVLDSQKRRVDEALKVATSRFDEVNKEAEGTASGIKGAGSATAAKRQTAELAQAEYLRERAALDRLQSPEALATQELAILEAKNRVLNDPKSAGLMLRMRTLFDLIRNNPELFWFWLFFTIMFVLVEILPITVKTSGQKGKNLYETWTELHSQPRSVA